MSDADSPELPPDTLPPSQDLHETAGIKEPPRTFVSALGQLGPGLIIASAIVGSGELIATTKTGAQAGISLLWLIIIGCVIKVFVQVELGRFTISHGQTTLAALNTIPGPRVRVNWLLWFWGLMMLAALGQLGGIVGGVGQSLAIAVPITGDYSTAIEIPSQNELAHFIKWDNDITGDQVELLKLDAPDQKRVRRGHQLFQERLALSGERGTTALDTVRSGGEIKDPFTWDDRIWAAIAALITVGLLWDGRYSLLQRLSTVLVVGFTAVTLFNVFKLQTSVQWHLSWDEIMQGLMFKLPRATPEVNPVATALATFGIIGVGATELISYPYWCIEKGYAKYTGTRTADEAWTRRARGWMKVMQLDANLSMVIYTTATIAFFLMGVSVLHREGRDPEGMRMVSTLASAYVPMFGEYAKWMFLVGAIAVLYSTFLIALAAQTRLYTDALKLWGFMGTESERTHQRSISTFGVILPLICLGIYCTGANPVTLVLISGVMQGVMLPLLAIAALYFRYQKTDARLLPSKAWDIALWISAAGLLIAGLWGVYARLT